MTSYEIVLRIMGLEIMERNYLCTVKHTHTTNTAQVWHNQHLWFKELRGEVWEYSSSLMCFLNGLLLGNEKDLTRWAKNQWGFTFTQPQDFYMVLTEDYYTKHLQKTGASQNHINSKYKQNIWIFDLTHLSSTFLYLFVFLNGMELSFSCYIYRSLGETLPSVKLEVLWYLLNFEVLRYKE